MKFMEKAKRFFTLSAKHEGFTLVELIVVIAILAILAGVAVPAYSGYINKSKEAADSNLLNAVNKAFAAACSANASDVYLVNSAQIKLEGGYVKNVTVPAEYDEAFQMFFEGNSNAKFETIEALYFDPGLHQFVDAAKAGKTVTLGGNNYFIKQNAINSFKGSVFADNVGAMQEQLGDISTAFSDVIGTADTAGDISPEFKAFMDANGYGDEDLGNAAVLYVAKNAGDYTAQDIAQLFQDVANKEPQNTKDFLNAVGESGMDSLTGLALMYGAVTAYANTEEGKNANPDLADQLADVKSGEDLLAAFGAIDGKAWGNYIGTADGGQITASSQFTNDVNGFLGAMDAINTVSPDVTMNDTGFWNSDEVSGLLSDLLG